MTTQPNDELQKAIEELIALHAEDFGPMTPLPKCLKVVKASAKKLQQVEKERDEWKATSESWESTAKLVSKLPCGHPNDCAYDVNNDGRWAHIRCVWCERDQLKAALWDLSNSSTQLIDALVDAANHNPMPVTNWTALLNNTIKALSNPVVQSALNQKESTTQCHPKAPSAKPI